MDRTRLSKTMLMPYMALPFQACPDLCQVTPVRNVGTWGATGPCFQESVGLNPQPLIMGHQVLASLLLILLPFLL